MARQHPIVLLPDASIVRPEPPLDDDAFSPPAPAPQGKVAARRTSRLATPIRLPVATPSDLHVRLAADRLGRSRGALTFTPTAWSFTMSPSGGPPVARWEWVRPDEGTTWEEQSGNQDVSVIIDLIKLLVGTAYAVEIAVRAKRRPDGLAHLWSVPPRYGIEQSETGWSWEPVDDSDEQNVRTLQSAFTAAHASQRLRLLPEAVSWLEVFEIVVRRI